MIKDLPYICCYQRGTGTNPSCPNGNPCPKKKRNGVSDMDIGDDEEEEEDDWDETDPEVKATADKEDDDS